MLLGALERFLLNLLLDQGCPQGVMQPLWALLPPLWTGGWPRIRVCRALAPEKPGQAFQVALPFLSSLA